MAASNAAAWQVSLKDVVRGTILSLMKAKLSETPPPSGGLVLVTDETADNVLADSNCTVDEMMDLEIREKTPLFGKRNARPQAAALYFVSPTLDCARKVVEDHRRHLYSGAYIFLTEDSDDFYDTVTAGAQDGILAYVAFALSFSPLESRIFHIHEPDVTLHMYLADGEEALNTAINHYASKFFHVLAALQCEPTIKYHDPSGSGRTIPARMAHALKSQIASYKTDTSDFPSPSPYDHLGPATVVIVDRSIDLIAPLLHTLAFQALAHDTFEIRKEINAKNIQHLMWKDERGDQKAPDAILDESSSVFNTLRHLFISLAWEEVNTAAKSIQQFTHRGKTSIEDLRFKVFQMQDVHAQKEQVSAISSLLEEIKAKMEQRSWREVAQVEQGIALGKGTDGAVLTRKKAIAAVADLLSKEDLDIEDKRRLLLILTLAIGGTSQDDFTSLWRAAMMDDTDHVMFRGIQFFSVDPEAARELMKNSTSWSIKSIFKTNTGSGSAEEDDYLQVYDGYQPRIARILQDQMDGRLDPREFRTVKGGQAEAEEASRRKKVGTIRRKLTDHGKIGSGVLVDFTHKDSDNKPMFVPKWGRARPRADGDLGGDYRGNGARTILIVIGGLSYAEVRAAYLTSMKNKRELYVGSTHMITPNEFMESIYMLGSTGDKPYNYMSGGVVEEHPFVIPPELLEDEQIQRHPSASSATSSAPLARSTPDLNSIHNKDLPSPLPSISTPDVRDVERLAASESMHSLSARPSFTASSYNGHEVLPSNDAVKDYGRPVSLQDGAALAVAERDRLRARSPLPTSIGETNYEFLSGRIATPPQSSASRGATPVIASLQQPAVPSTMAPNYAKSGPRPYAQEPLAPPVLHTRTSSQGLNLQPHTPVSSTYRQPQQPTPYRPNSAVPPDQGYGSSGIMPPRSPAPSTGSFDNASTRSGGGGGAPHLSVNELLQYSSQNLSFDKQVEEVMAMAPQYPRHVIEADLVYTGIVEITIERIVTGILPIQGMTYPKRQSTALAAHNASLRQDSASSSGSTAAFGSSQQDSYRGQSNSHPTYTQQSQYTQQQPSFSQPPQQHQQQYAAPPYNQQGYGQLHQSQPQYAHHALQQQQQQGYYGQQQQQQASAPHQPQPQYASIQQQYRPGNSAPSYPSYPTQSPQLAPGALYGQVPGRASTPSSSSSYDARAGSQRAGSGFSVLGPSQGGGGVGRMALEEQGRIGSGAVGVYSPGAGSGRPSMGGAPVPAPAPVGTVLDPFPGWEGGWPLALTSQLQKYSKAKREYEKTLGR